MPFSGQMMTIQNGPLGANAYSPSSDFGAAPPVHPSVLNSTPIGNSGSRIGEIQTAGAYTPAPQGYFRNAEGRAIVDTPQARNMHSMMDAITSSGVTAQNAAMNAPGGNWQTGQAAMMNMLQQAPNHLIPELLRNQQEAGRLGLQSSVAFGINGIPGTVQNAAQESNARFSPAGQLNSTWQQILTAGIQAGTPIEQIIEGMRGAGIPLPNMLAGMGEQTNPDTNQTQVLNPRTNPVVPPVRDPNSTVPPVDPNARPVVHTPIATRIQNALRDAMAIHPQIGNNPNTRTLLPYAVENHPAYNRAITNYFSQFSDEDMGNNYQQIAEAINRNRYFGNIPLTGWQQNNVPFVQNSPLRTVTPEQQAHARERARVVRAQGGNVGISGPFGIGTLGNLRPGETGVGFGDILRQLPFVRYFNQ